jgi:DNA-binding winged helix-turn-helix (wHTH) protein/TolB-like protein/Tfp pilus assembly protein PilF
MHTGSGRKYQVGDYLIDTGRYRISSGDTAVPVEPKVFDLLVYLIRNRDRVLTREELFEAIWEGREISDATLSNHVRSARKVLGDNGELQQTIQTTRGRGYQFIAPVREIAPIQEMTDDAAAPGADRAPAPPPDLAVRPARRFGLVPLLLAALLLIPTVLFGGWRLLNAPAPPPEPGRPYLLVVPFGVSDNATQDHRMFADQLTREVIDNLRKISGLRVVPQSSAFGFRKDKTRGHVQELLPEVQFVLDSEVSVGPDGTLRITPRLADLRKDLDVWNKAFTVRIDNRDFFATAAGIARAVAVALKVEILKDEQRALAEFPNNPKAYEPYAAGWREMELFTHESMQRAVASFDRAIELDPDFLAAHLARSEALRTIFAYFEPPIMLLPKVKASLEEVLRRDPESAEALASLGMTQVLAWQWREGWENLSRAKALDNSLALTELGFALYYSGLGENQKLKDSLARAEQLDPMNFELADWGTWALVMAGEQQAARAWSEKQMRRHPDNGFVFCGAGISASLRGDTAEGVALLEKGAALVDRAPVTLIMLAQGYGYDGQKDKVLPLLEEADRAKIYMCPYETAVAYLSLGDEASKAKAVKLLYESVDKRSNCLIFLRNDPRMKVLREDPRHAASFAQLLTLVGLDDEAVRTYKK